MSIQPSTFVKEHAPWSISKAGVAKNCPHAFYLKYIKKVRVDKPMNADALVGVAVHEALRHALSGTDIARCLSKECEINGLATKEIDRVMGFEVAARNFIRKFRAYQKKNNGLEPVLEKKFAMDWDGKPASYRDNSSFLRGALDLYMVFKGKPHALILDHKTGKDHDLTYFENQFNSYILLLKAAMPHLTGIALGINFLKTDAIELKNSGKLCDVRDVTPIFERLVAYFNTATEDTHKFDQCNPNVLCNWCDFKGICPAHSGGTNGRKIK